MKFWITAFVLSLLFVCLLVEKSDAQIKSDTLTIRQVQEVHPDTLATGKQDSPYHRDTVTVSGIVVAKARLTDGGPMLFALGNAYTVYIMDENGGPWSGLNLRASDSVASASTLLAAVDTGFVIRVTGVVTQYFTTTQFEIGVASGAYAGMWNANVPVEILDTKPRRPDPTEIKISDLVSGAPNQPITSAAQWEGAYVIIKDAVVGTVTKNPSTGRFTWTIADGQGNSIGVYDQSVYFRGGSQGFNPNWEPPVPGTQISAMRGIITSSGQGIVIAPLYPGDITLGSFPPVIRNLARDKAIPKSTETVEVTCEVEDSNVGGTIQSVQLHYGTGTSNLGMIGMTYNSGTKQAVGTIPAQPDGSIIWYFIVASDNSGETTQFPGDITKARPFYVVKDGMPKIRDVQYTPYRDGLSGSIGFQVTLRGTVVADSSLGLTYIQDDTQPWSGIMIRGGADIRALTLGDDVTVTGKVAEGYSSSTTNNTVLTDATIDQNHGKVTPPAPVLLQTGTFETEVVPDGHPDAEQWEGMLVRFDNVSVTSTNADEASGRNFGEFLISDGGGSARVDDIGSWKNVYTTDSTATGRTYLMKGTRIGSLAGIMFYSFGNYKLQPRSASDFQNVVTSVERPSAVPSSANLLANYPNPFAVGTYSFTTIPFTIQQASHVRLAVYDALGREVSVLVNGVHAPGAYTARWSRNNVPAGLYVYRLTVDGNVESRTMVVSK